MINRTSTIRFRITTLLSMLVCPAFFLPFSDCAAEVKSKIAVILPETGNYSAISVVMKESVAMAVERELGKFKIRIELVYIDNYSNPDSAEAITLKIAADRNFIGILAGYPSSCAYRTLVISEQYAIPYLIASSSADSLTIRELEYTFRLAPISSDYNDGLVSWAATYVGQGRLISVVHDGQENSVRAVEDIRIDTQTRWRGAVEFTKFSPGELEYNALIKQQQNLNPDLVWMIGNTTDIARFLRECRRADWSPRAFVLGSVNLVNDRIISLADGAAEYAYGPAVWTGDEPYPGLKKFVENYTDRTGEKPVYQAAEAYAAIEVLSSALLKCDKFNRKNLRDQLAAIDILSIFGRIRFDDFREFKNQNRSRTVCVQLLDLNWQSVWPSEIASSKYVYPSPDWRERDRADKPINNNQFIYVLFIILTIILLVMTFMRIKDLKRKIEL